MTLGDRVAVLADGRLQQCATPRELYAQPANTFVAGFIGSPAMNLCSSRLGANGSVALGGVDMPITREARALLRDVVVIGLRPESLELATEGIPAEVEVVEEIGADSYVFAAAEIGGVPTKLVARVETKHAPERGARVTLRPRAGEAHLFDPETGGRVSS
jgi:multiple sugar transport system ATP-binding protein